MLSWYGHLSILLEIKGYDGELLSDMHEDMMTIIDNLEDLPVTDTWIEHDIQILRKYFGGGDISGEMQNGAHLSLGDEAQLSHGIGKPNAANTDGQSAELADEGEEASDHLDFSNIEENPELDDEVSYIVEFLDTQGGRADTPATGRETRHDRGRERAQYRHHAMSHLRLRQRSRSSPHPSTEGLRRMGRSCAPR